MMKSERVRRGMRLLVIKCKGSLSRVRLTARDRATCARLRESYPESQAQGITKPGRHRDVWDESSPTLMCPSLCPDVARVERARDYGVVRAAHDGARVSEDGQLVAVCAQPHEV